MNLTTKKWPDQERSDAARAARNVQQVISREEARLTFNARMAMLASLYDSTRGKLQAMRKCIEAARADGYKNLGIDHAAPTFTEEADLNLPTNEIKLTANGQIRRVDPPGTFPKPQEYVDTGAFEATEEP